MPSGHHARPVSRLSICASVVSGNCSGYSALASHHRPINRFTDGGKSTQPNGNRGDRYTRPFWTALTDAQTGSVFTAAANAGSMVIMTSGFHASTCSTETVAMPPRRSPATLWAPRNSIVSTLIDPPRPVSKPRGPRPW